MKMGQMNVMAIHMKLGNVIECVQKRLKKIRIILHKKNVDYLDLLELNVDYLDLLGFLDVDYLDFLADLEANSFKFEKN